MSLTIPLNDSLDDPEVVELYNANAWSSAEKPRQLLAALRNFHALVTARLEGRLVGLGNAISDGRLVMYFPHMLMHPEFQRQDVGRAMMGALTEKYEVFHQKVLTAHGKAVEFYNGMGASGRAEPSQCGVTRAMTTGLREPKMPTLPSSGSLTAPFKSNIVRRKEE